MTDPQRVVIDTSTLIGAVLRPGSVPRQAFLAAVSSYELCLSAATLEELRRVLGRAKIDRYAPREQRTGFWALVAERSRLWEIDATSVQASRASANSLRMVFLLFPVIRDAALMPTPSESIQAFYTLLGGKFVHFST